MTESELNVLQDELELYPPAGWEGAALPAAEARAAGGQNYMWQGRSAGRLRGSNSGPTERKVSPGGCKYVLYAVITRVVIIER